MKLLFLYNKVWFKSIALLPKMFRANGFEIDFYWTSEGEFPTDLKSYQAVYLSGSVANPDDGYPWIARLTALLQRISQLRLPTLGSCFGSQILATFLCGDDQVFRRNNCALGYADISLQHSEPEDPLLQGLSSSLRMFVWHNLQVKSGHPDMKILGYNDDCSNYIWRYRDLPVWKIQGHLELDSEAACSMSRRYHRFFKRTSASIAELVNSAEINTEAIKLFNNFINYCKLF